MLKLKGYHYYQTIKSLFFVLGLVSTQFILNYSKSNHIILCKIFVYFARKNILFFILHTYFYKILILVYLFYHLFYLNNNIFLIFYYIKQTTTHMAPSTFFFLCYEKKTDEKAT